MLGEKGLNESLVSASIVQQNILSWVKDGCNLWRSKPKATALALICTASKASCEALKIKEKGKIKGMNYLGLTCPLVKLSGEVAWGGTFKPFCCQTQQGSIKSMNPQFGWYYYCLCQPHCLHLHGKQDLEGHMLLPLRRCTLSLLPTKKGKVLEGLPLFASFLFFWVEENVLDLHW